MKIVILGAGQVGSSVAENLASEANDITVVDIDGTRLRNLQDRLDLRTVVGSAAHPSVLVEAGIEDCDLMIAVTQSDETNLVACKLAQQLFNVPTRIVRLRATDYLAFACQDLGSRWAHPGEVGSRILVRIREEGENKPVRS